jgi:uncharacterized protein YbjT (DUF2867 family)
LNKEKKALIIGATGLIGNELVKLVSQSDYYQRIYLLVRRKTGFESDKVIEILADFEYLKESLKSIHADDIYNCLGTTMKNAGSKEEFYKVDFSFPIEIARIMKKKGSETFLNVSALGAKKSSIIFYNRVKGELEEALRDTGFKSLIIFRPSLLLGNRKEKRTGEDIAKKTYKVLDKIFVGPFRKYSGINGQTVAYAMFEMAKRKPQGLTILESNKIKEV